MRSRSARSTEAAPDEASLQDAALNYLARYAATASGLRRVLDKRIDRWARAADDQTTAPDLAAAAKRLVPPIVQRLTTTGAVNDTAFAESRARGLSQAGRSQRAITAKLMEKGVDAELAHASVPDNPEAELGAALVLARRRRIGPFRIAAQPENDHREMGVFARAGFSRAIALRALAMEPDEAEDAIHRLRQT